MSGQKTNRSADLVFPLGKLGVGDSGVVFAWRPPGVNKSFAVKLENVTDWNVEAWRSEKKLLENWGKTSIGVNIYFSGVVDGVGDHYYGTGS